MAIETWGWVAAFSAALIVYWLAGFIVGEGHEHGEVGVILGTVPVMGLVISVMAIVGWWLVK